MTFSLSVFIMYEKYYKYRDENEGKVYHARDCRHCQKAEAEDFGRVRDKAHRKIWREEKKDE